MTKPPNPGSDAALALGCKCPVLDNGRGRGAWGGALVNGKPVFWHSATCPVHSRTQDSVSGFCKRPRDEHTTETGYCKDALQPKDAYGPRTFVAV